MPAVHPTAILSAEVDLEDGAEVGPYCILTGPVRLAGGVRLIANICIHGPAEIGAGTVVYPFASIGFPAQDVKVGPGDRTAGVRVGARCILREQATIHAATNDHTPTTIGDRVFMMVGSHIGHDSRVGDGTTFVNLAGIGGHVQVGDGAVLSGGSLVHQHTRIGRLAMLSGSASISMDVPPFCLAYERNRIIGINLVGLRRAGMPRDHIVQVREAFRECFRGFITHDEMVRILERRGRDCPPVAEMARFVADKRRSICPGTRRLPRQLISGLHQLRRGVAQHEPVPGDEHWS